jgi:hypothetical protein
MPGTAAPARPFGGGPPAGAGGRPPAGDPAARIRVISSCNAFTRCPVAWALAVICSRSSSRSASIWSSALIRSSTGSFLTSSAAPISTTQTAASSTAKRIELSLPPSSATRAATGARPTPAQISAVSRRAFCGTSASRSDMVADATETGVGDETAGRRAPLVRHPASGTDQGERSAGGERTVRTEHQADADRAPLEAGLGQRSARVQ